MMKRFFFLLWVVVIFTADPGRVKAVQPAAVKASWLYQVNRASIAGRTLSHPPGQAVPGLAHTRKLTDWSQTRQLTASERLTIQSNVEYHAMFTPNDPQYGLQWNIAQINIPAAWDTDLTPPLYGGDPNVIVAVIDTGLAYENFGNFTAAPDLAGTAIWTNPKEVAGDGIDNDGNGLIDDVHGWDFVNNDAHPNDDNGHGTHVSGTIAETSDNGIAVAGIAWQSTLMPLKALDNSGSGTTDAFAAAIDYAAGHGADIINLSLGGTDPDPLLQAALNSALAKGVIIVAAAGNDGVNRIDYPAKYTGVTAVGATQYDQARTSYSNFGPELDLMAPGGNIDLDQNNDGQPDGIAQQTCTPGACTTFDNVVYYSGTSQATAHVTAVAALLAACGAPSGNIIPTMQSTATDLGASGRDDEYGYGVVNAVVALNAVGCNSAPPQTPVPITGQASSAATRPILNNHAYIYGHPVFSWMGTAGATYQVRWGKSGQIVTPTIQTTATFSPKITAEGSYQLVVNVIDALGRVSGSQQFTYRYRRPVLVVSFNTSVRLYKVVTGLIRSFSGGFGTAKVNAAGGSLVSDDSNRIISFGRDGSRSMKIMNTRGAVLQNLTPFSSNFSGVIDTVIIDSNVAEPMFVVSTATRGAEVRWYRPNGAPIAHQLLYQSYRGGLRLASGDLDGDGQDELIVAQAAGPEIRVYNSARQRLSVFKPLGASYQGGWRVTSGDWEGDGQEEIVIIPSVGSTSIPVYVTNLKGIVKKVWRLKIANNSKPVDIEALDVDGNGRDELLALPAEAPLVVYQWSLGGLSPRTITLSPTDRDGRLSGLR